MKESNWEECIETSSSLKVSPDKSKSNSLIDIARGRNRYLRENAIKESNANYVFEGYYSSVLELLHAIFLLKGYKVSNHLCLAYYLRDIMKREDLFRLFDGCRFKRNSLVYYGRKMDFETAKITIRNAMELIKELENFLTKEFKIKQT